MKSAFHAIVFAALLAGCGIANQDHRNDKDTFGQAFTWEWRNQNAPAARASAPPTAQPVDASKEREEFEEWKRKNQK